MIVQFLSCLWSPEYCDYESFTKDGCLVGFYCFYMLLSLELNFLSIRH
jgi:hypothetical protein